MRKVEHYSPGWFKPPFIQKTWKRTLLPCHCLIVHEDERILLVDCGMHPNHLGSRLPTSLTKSLLGAHISSGETMKAHLEKRGLARMVSDVLVTHLHYDHTGGLVDFPKARVHLHRAEWAWAHDGSGQLKKNVQFVAATFSHVKEPVLYDQFPLNWNGFPATPLTGLSSDILMIPLPGHSPGHCGYVVPCGEETFFHVGDAFFVLEDLDDSHNAIVPSEIVQIGIAFDSQKRSETLRKIKKLQAQSIPGLQIINSHDLKLLDRTK